MQRALWKGAISFGLVHIPVELFSAEKNSELDFTMLDRRDFSPVGYKRYNKKSGKEVDWDNIVKAYEYESGQYVVMSDEDLRRANVKATQTIDIQAFVDARELDLTYYERPYYLVPGKGGDKVYALLRETLQRAGKIAITQVVIRTRQHLAALLPMGEAIVLDTLRYADEIRPPDEFDLPDTNLKKAGISEKEVEMALSLVEGMSEKWKPSGYHDSYRNDVLAMVKKKIKAHQTKTITMPEHGQDELPARGQVIDLMALLKKSLDGKGPRSSVKRTGAARPASAASKPASRAKSRHAAGTSNAPLKERAASTRRARA